MKIRIGHLEYDVVPVPNLHNDRGGKMYGEITYPTCTITVDTQFIDSQRYPEILLHEVIHGILDNAGLDQENLETAVAAISNGLVDTLRRNPDLASLING